MRAGRNVFGLAPTERNIAHMAELGVSWMPMERNPEKLSEPIRQIRQKYRAAGRSEADLEIMVFAEFLFDKGGKPDLDATLALVPQYAEIGVTTLQFAPAAYTDTVEGYRPIMERIQRVVKG